MSVGFSVDDYEKSVTVLAVAEPGMCPISSFHVW